MLRPSHKDDFLERTKAARKERQLEKIGGKMEDGNREDAMLRPSHKGDFLERTKAAREERQLEKI